jgi:hypothetical protein
LERVRGAIAALALCAAAALAAAPAARAQPDPYAIYDRARSFWLGQVYPPYLAYDVAVSVEESGAQRVERYRSGFDAVDDSVWVDPVSDYEREHPHVVHGMNVDILVFRVSKPEAPVDFVGVPILAPAYSFGMAPFVAARPPDSAQDAAALVAAVRRSFDDPYPSGRTPPPPGGSTQLPLIAHSIASRDIYRIELLGEETVNGHLCYHLALQPLRDPGRYRLRQLWIDERSAATWRLQEALNFVSGPGTTVPWTVNFRDLGGAQYIADETADETMRYDGRQYARVRVAFENLRAVTVPQGNPLYIPPSHDTLQEP